MYIFSRLIIKSSKIIILGTILITLVMGYYLKDLKINSDIISYLPKDDPDVELFNYVGEEYGGSSLAMVAIEADDIFNKETIKKLSYLSSQFKFLEGVSFVTSLANVIDIKSDEYGMEIGRLIDEYELPETPEELQELKNYTLSKDMYRGRLVSEDAKTTLIICKLQKEIDQVETARQLKEIVNNSNLKEKVYFGGIPFQMIDVTDIILGDLFYLTPIIFLLIFISLFLSFRTLRGVLLPLLSVSISTIWTLGIMSILHIPITVISDIVPVILIAVGSAYSIHVISKFDEGITADENGTEHLENALSEIVVPVTLTALTTIAGFIAFVFGSYLNMIREFGIFSSLGVLFALITSVTFVPSILSMLHVKDRKRYADGDYRKKGITQFMDRIGELVLKNEKLIIAVAIVVVVISILGIPGIERKVDMLDYFKPGSSIRLTEEIMETRFGGSIPIQILAKGDIQDPKVLKEIERMEDFLESQKNVSNAQSIAYLIKEMAEAMGEGKDIPDSKAKISNLWFLLEGEEIMSQLVNEDKTEAVIQATILNLDTKQIRDLTENVDKQIEKVDESLVIFTQTGLPSIYQKLDDSILRSQKQSLSLAIVFVFICLVILLRSFIGGLIGLVPIVFALLIVFGFMGFFKIPLDVATVLVGSISIGIGIDYSIHFVSRFRKEFKKAESELEALDRTLETAGKAILINVITVVAGFLVLLMAKVIPLQRFGVLVAITMIGSGAGAITLLPAIILVTKAGFVGDFERFMEKAKERILSKKKGNNLK